MKQWLSCYLYWYLNYVRIQRGMGAEDSNINKAVYIFSAHVLMIITDTDTEFPKRTQLQMY